MARQAPARARRLPAILPARVAGQAIVSTLHAAQPGWRDLPSRSHTGQSARWALRSERRRPQFGTDVSRASRL